MASVRQRRYQIAAYVLLAVGLALALGVYQRHVNRSLEHGRERNCALLTFTRQTQREVVEFLQETSTLLSTTSRTPVVRAYFRDQLPHLNELRARTAPPPCR